MCVYWYRYYLIFAFYIWRYFLICVFVCELTYFFWWIYRFTCSPTHHRRIYVGTSYSTSMRCCFVGDEQTQSAGGFCILHNHKVYSRFADRALWTCLQRRSRQGSQKGKWRPDCYGCQQDQTGSNRIKQDHRMSLAVQVSFLKLIVLGNMLNSAYKIIVRRRHS